MQTKKLILIAAISILVGGGLGFGTNYLINSSKNDRSSASQEEQKSTNNDSTSESEQAVGNKVDNSESLKLVKGLYHELNLGYPFVGDFYSGAHKVADNSHYINVDGFGLVHRDDRAAAEARADLNKIVANLKTKDFKQIEKIGADTDGQNVFYAFKNDKIACSVVGDFLTSDDQGPRGRIGVGCADLDFLKRAESFQEPLWAAYGRYAEKKGIPTDDRSLVVLRFSLDQVKPSRAEGYKLAWANSYSFMGVGGFGITFYQRPDQSWEVAFSGQQMGPCSDFTEEAKKALNGSGERCFSGEQEVEI